MPASALLAARNSLPLSLAMSWRVLKLGVEDRDSGYHLVSVATLGLDGQPRQRTMVLRHVDEGERSLYVHADRRSEKLRELQADPRINVLAYDPASKIQIRMSGQASLHFDDRLADSAWQGARAVSRVCYGTVPGPGTIIQQGGDFSLPFATDAASAPGREHFAVIGVHVRTLEWLHLAAEGHRRAKFEWDAAGALSARWLAP